GDRVVAAGHKTEPEPELRDSGPFVTIYVTRRETIEEVVDKYDIGTIYHMAAILSATGEKDPQLAYRVNLDGLYTVLEIAREHDVSRVFGPVLSPPLGRTRPRIVRRRRRSCGRPRCTASPRLRESYCATTTSSVSD
ncbi:MAG: NAD-dependent epimerase/dehydratase family protein, partial [Anaerolineae bacterium]